MSQVDPRIPEYVAVECPVCYTRMHARPAKAPGKIKCPDCYTLARVPSISDVLATLPRQRAQEAVGTYDLGAEVNPAVEDATPDWPTAGTYGLSTPIGGARDAFSAPTTDIAAGLARPAMRHEPEPEPRRESREPNPGPPRGRSPSGSDELPRPTVREESERVAGSFAVACPACGARIEPPASHRPQTILCPECLEDVHVPARRETRAADPGPDAPATPQRAPVAQRRRQPAERPQPAGKVGTKPAPATAPAERPQGRKAQAQRASSTPGTSPSARTSAPAEKSRTHVSLKAPAPARHDDAPNVTPPGAAPEAERIEFAAVEYPQPPRGPVNVFEALAEIRQEQPDPPPRSTFFSGVFEFPWRPDVLVRWIYLTLGFTMFGLVVAGYVVMAETTQLWLLILMLFMPPLVAAGGLALSYAASCFLPILIDTAAGNDRVRSWFDSDWKEWAVQFMYLVCLLFVALLFGHAIGLLASVTGATYGLVLGVGAYFAFPIVVLSSQEANSVFVPVSLPILRSMARSAWVWLMFYALSGLLVGAAALLIVLESEVSPFLALIASGPVVSTVVLIYPRLLGRLAWRASLTGSRRRKRKRKRPVEFPAPAGGAK